MRSHDINLLALLSMALGCMMLFGACRYRNILTRDNSESKMSQLIITHIAGGSYCGVDSSMNLVITSPKEWADLWEKVNQGSQPEVQLPEVDFSAETVLAVFLGTRSSGGYSVEISHPGEINGRIKVKARASSPAPGDMVTTALTQPFHIVKINVSGKEVEIIRN